MCMRASSIWIPSSYQLWDVLTKFEKILSHVLRRCGCASVLSNSWLFLPPLGAFSETWLSSVFIGSCPGLTSNEEVRGGLPTTAADGLYTVLKLSDDGSGKCMRGVLHCTKASLKTLAKVNSSFYAQLLNTFTVYCNRSSGECAVTSNHCLFKHYLWQVIS